MRILEVLGRQHLMTVATIRPDGYPQATTVNKRGSLVVLEDGNLLASSLLGFLRRCGSPNLGCAAFALQPPD